MSSLKREVSAIIKNLVKNHGCTASLTSGSHWRVTREGYPAVTISQTPSGGNRAIQNIKADCKRYLNIKL